MGKTTLTTKLANQLNAEALLEEFEDNPFLDQFYQDPERFALSTQLFFLMSRFRQQQRRLQPNLFQPFMIADYLFDKDHIFAEINLDTAEQRIYDQLYTVLQPQVISPDLVIYLTASHSTIMERIRQRNRSYEQEIDPAYLRLLSTSYHRFFSQYQEAPVIQIHTDELDLRNDNPVTNVLAESIASGQLPTSEDMTAANKPRGLFT